MAHSLCLNSFVVFMEGEAMTDIQPKYFDQADPCLAYLEFTAIKKFAFNGRATDVYDAFDCSRKSMVWTEVASKKAKQEHKDILTSMRNG